MGSSGMGGGMGGSRVDDVAPSYRPQSAVPAYSKPAEPPRGVKKGMQVGGKVAAWGGVMRHMCVWCVVCGVGGV